MVKAWLDKVIEPFGGLQAKACTTLMVVVVVTAAAIGTTAFRKTRSQMIEQASRETLNTARLVATTCYDRYAAKDASGLVAVCQQMVADERLLYVAFLDDDGRLVAAAQKPHTLVELLEEHGGAIKEDCSDGLHVRHLSGQKTAMEAVVPIAAQSAAGGGRIGTVLLAADSEPLEVELGAMADQTITLTSAIAILVIALGSVVIRHLVSPINELSKASIDLAQRHEFHEVKLHRRDELGRLSQAFNHMGDRLLRTQRELLELNAELEQRVALRTSELETRNKQLRRLASKDPLTSLYNRRSFGELLRREIAEAERYERELACMMIDVDNFKHVNDVHGHQAGDEVLRLVAELIRKEMRQSDVTARFGGDEFVVLLPQCNAREAFHLAKRIREQAHKTLHQWGPEVALSIGIADLRLSKAKTGEALIKAADKALYKVKAMGKDGIAAATGGETVQAA